MTFWSRFVIAALAAWRVTHLLAEEDGPADLIARLRARLGTGLFGKLMDCFECLSIWVAIPFAFFVAQSWLERLVAMLAISGVACLLERLARESPSVAVFQHGEDQHGMLRSEEADNEVLHQDDLRRFEGPCSDRRNASARENTR